jgi:cysteinyl-tRNA synthetase
LWKSYKDGEPFWESPWGKGRPGWHIECTAMSIEYLGESIDIHGGGLDLVFPHHENEIAQSESFTGVKPFARFWVHNGTLQYGSDKMSKSIGNVFSIGQALEKYSSDDLRMFFLNSHYRRPLTYSEEIVGHQSRAVERLRNALMATSGEGSQMECDIYEAKFCEAMDDDMNTPRALAVLFELAREINKGSSEGYGIDEAQEVLSVLAGVLGFTLMQPRQDSKGDIEPFVEILINTRIKLRESKLFEFADQIRDELLSQGVVLEDSVDGTDWKYLS